MWKKVLISVILIMIIIIGMRAFYTNNQSKKNESDVENFVNNVEEISSEYVTDECLNEWRDYSLTIQDELKEASQNLNDENRTYIVKAEDNYIKIYYLNNNNEEILYRVTDIAVQYLGENDVEELKQGIRVVGLQKLNQLIEDFE